MEEVYNGRLAGAGQAENRSEERTERAEKEKLEQETGQKINWVEPEERYFDKGEFIGPNTYRNGKLDSEN